MKNIAFILLLIISISLHSQEEIRFDTLPPLHIEDPIFKKGLLPDEKLNNYLNLNDESKLKSDIFGVAPSLRPSLSLEKSNPKNLNIPPIYIYVGPPTENLYNTSFPFANDYSFYGGHMLSDNLWLTSSSIKNTYPSLGGINSVNVQLNYQPAEWLRISGGPYGAKYNYPGFRGGNLQPLHFNDYGVNGNVKFIITDRIRINGYGQYSVNAKNNGIHGPMMGMYPQTYYGGSLEFKITEKFGVEGGIIRELNPLNGKWENRSFFAPVFYGK